MYICICNAICDKRINNAIDDGHHSVKQVYSACGAKERCGSCASDIKNMIHEKRKPMPQFAVGD